ncbi:MAG: hypothetical protein ACFE0J_17455 [Elainellaceae cyanobacterium]
MVFPNHVRRILMLDDGFVRSGFVRTGRVGAGLGNTLIAQQDDTVKTCPYARTPLRPTPLCVWIHAHSRKPLRHPEI